MVVAISADVLVSVVGASEVAACVGVAAVATAAVVGAVTYVYTYSSGILWAENVLRQIHVRAAACAHV